ncbi:hypothetical protein [Leptospira noguchii]|uniref:Uncharacterized protein n=1 Tax=Leptospira noguchii str. 2001034031 TaxID=1193053 RepID=M6XYT4_9LEPT|nr:hypothetical protein [Leptospira noguchii]EMO87267.1 hypothetical protein LEP1GSC024_0260 [Leptospira noguchii str. 2001034031]
MHNRSRLKFFIILTLLQINNSIQSADFGTFRIHLRGLGPIHINDTLIQIEKKLSIKLKGGREKNDFGDKACYFYSAPELSGVSLMFTGYANDVKLSRIYISNPNFQTLSGLKLRSDISLILSTYKDNIQQTKEHYTGDMMLIFVPKDQSDKNFRIIFLTDNKKVTQISVGKIPEIFAVEGCD